MMKGAGLLAAAAAGALAMYLYDRKARVGPRQPFTDPSIPPSESSATRLRDKPGYAQEDPDQETRG
jgi:hypothetical protein